MQTALEIRNLSKSYGKFHLDNINFTLPRGHIMGFIGSNGSGKTTTIKLILNMVHRDKGNIKICNLDNIKFEEQLKQDIGVVFDKNFLCEKWNAVETECAIAPFYNNWDSKMFRNMVTRFRIAPKKEVRELSRGMQMRLMLACALSHNAKLLILDEPTSGLDPIIRDELLSILAEYTMSTEKSILFSTHITSDLEKIADYITFIDNGKMIYSGKKDQLISSFKKIEGKSINVTKQQTDKILGYRENNALFEGIIHTDNLHDFSNVVIKPATMDEIMVFIHKGDTDDE